MPLGEDSALDKALDFVIRLGPVCTAIPLFVFGLEHFKLAQPIAGMVPRWIPAHLFWAYFVGVALVASAVGLLLPRTIRLTAGLLGIMFMIFVLTIHLPNAISNPGNRILWTLVFRETAFACGVLAVAAPPSQTGAAAITRTVFGLIAIFFGIEHFLHPTLAIVVPLEKQMPDWIPLRALWCYLCGVVLLVMGAALVANKRPRSAAGLIGSLGLAVTILIYGPILIAVLTANPQKTGDVIEGINYFADTLLFAGTTLLLARSQKNA